MTTHSIKFDQQFIPAILDGSKTQFMLPIDPQPNFPFGIKSIVSVPDVFHNDAFRGTPADGFGTKGKRENKFYCEDYCGNLIAEFNFQFPYKIGDQLRVQSNFAIDEYEKDDALICISPIEVKLMLALNSSIVKIEIMDIRVERDESIWVWIYDFKMVKCVTT